MPQASKDSFSRAIEGLVRKYEADRNTYLSSQYNEAQTRTQFITPMLEALGWDVRNEAGVPYNLCEVLEEKGETHGRPDYTFRINGQTRFFLEAKSPSDELSSASILQTKRYAWNSRDIFFAGVCDFEQFRFFDASLRPDEKRPLDGEAFHLIYNEYALHLDTLWELSRDRVAAGSLDQFLRKDRKSLLQKIPVDKDFLENLTNWRHDLANAIHSQNPEHHAHALNEIVQRLLDRIIFIRIAEDRKVIDQRQLWDIAGIWEESGGRRDIMPLLVDLFRDFNTRFNGEIFKPHACEEIKIESHVLSKIIRQLYPPKSNYRFDVIGVELLGSIYERYLGNTLRITPKRVFIEPKPEVRKAGGVYYTPQYIVDYIVKNTVGKLVEGKTPKEVDKIRILDPACGSGSFLIGAFQFLIEWYLDYYREHPKESKPGTIFALTRTDENGNLRLSFSAKSLILRQNLYGVDIDQQAVEVTMMSLYLKMLEGELGIQIPKQDKLPELKYNIRCGNSLIGPDIEKDHPLTLEERQRINPFDWNSRESGFGDILKSGGFDVVIGNPPYVRQESLSEFKRYFKEHYQSFDGGADLYVYFMEKGVCLLKEGGYYSIIVSSSFLRTTYATPLRKLLKKATAILRIVDFGGLAVFENAKDTYVCIPLLSKQPQPLQVEIIKVSSLAFETLSEYVRSVGNFAVLCERLTPEAWSLKTDDEARVFAKLMSAGIPLDRYAGKKMFYGIKTGLNEAFELTAPQAKLIQMKFPVSRSLIKPVLGGEDIRRYFITNKEKFWIVIPSGWTVRAMREDKVKGPVSEKEAWAWFSKKHKGLAEHLRQFEARCRQRQDQGEFWWELRPCDYYDYFDAPKMIFPDIAKAPRFHLDLNGFYLANTGYCLGLADKYLLGLLNSRVFWFAISHISIPFGMRAGRYRYRLIYQYMAKIPIRVVDDSELREKNSQTKIIGLVEQMLELNDKKQSGKLASAELQRLEREITETDAQIDNLVYELYGITDEERKIIEEQS